MIAPSREVRTQSFIVPLFVALVYLLSKDSRRPSNQVFWVLPILVLWANLHGTVTLGAGLVGLHALVILFQRRGALLHGLRAWGRPLALIAGAAAAILLTPYGLSMIGYYRSTMVSSTLRHAVTEWQPVTSAPLTAAALVVVAGLAVVVLRTAAGADHAVGEGGPGDPGRGRRVRGSQRSLPRALCPDGPAHVPGLGRADAGAGSTPGRAAPPDGC